MKLIELKQYINNDYDKEIIERMCRDNEDNLNKYIASVICDLLQYIPMDPSFKSIAINNINNYNKNDIAEIGTYISLIPYVQLKLRNHDNVATIANSLIEMLISYLVGYINKDEFIKHLSNMRILLDMSDNFFNNLVFYFTYQNKSIINEIKERLK